MIFELQSRADKVKDYATVVQYSFFSFIFMTILHVLNLVVIFTCKSSE